MGGKLKDLEKRPILLIDDDAEYSEMVITALNALAAQDGLQGIEVARAAQPAVIPLDIIMPEMDRITTCERLKRDPILRNIPVVGITGSPDLTLVEKAYAAGAQFFLPKPFTAEALAHVLRSVTEETPVGTSRRDARFAVELPVRCRVRGHPDSNRVVEGQTANLSLGGLLLLVLSEMLERGTVVSLELLLPEGPLAADGAVIWQDPQPKDDGSIAHGIRLLRFADDADLVRFRRFVTEIAANNDPMKPTFPEA